MNIVKDHYIKPAGQLKNGDCFLFCDSVFMKVTDNCTDSLQCVNLKTGLIMHFREATLVTLVSCICHVGGYKQNECICSESV